MVATSDTITIIRMVGRITAKQGSCFRDILDQSIGHPKVPVVMDTESCSGVDSTILGIIACKTQEQFKRAGEHLTFINTPEKLSECLLEFGLEGYLQIFAPGSCPTSIINRAESCSSVTQTVVAKPMNRDERNEVMLEAHEGLANLNEQNRLQFDDVLTFLRKSAQKKALPPT